MTATWPEEGPPRLVVLAAGASSRLGQPKALVNLPGGPPITRILRAWPGDPKSTLVVTGAHHFEISQVLQGEPQRVQILHHKAWELGRTGSLQAAISQSSGHDLMVAPVDCPRTPSPVFRALLERWDSEGAPAMGWCAPFLVDADTGKIGYGHPILIGRALLSKATEMAPDAPLRELRRIAHPLLGVQVSHTEILEDLDTPEDLKRLIREDLQSP